MAALEDELDAFRREWISETRLRRPHAEPSAAVTSATPPPTSQPPTVRHAGLENDLETLRIEPKETPTKPLSAVETYDLAVTCERDGRLNDALIHYRQAFRLDPEVDKAYRQHLERSLPASEPTGDFTFQRTIQLGPDYVHDPDKHRSTSAYTQSLLLSFSAHPFRRSTGDGHEETEGPVLEPTHFHAHDVERSSPIDRLPPEILHLLLRHVALSAVIPPVVALPPPETASQKPGKARYKRLSPREERYRMEVEVSAPGASRSYATSRIDVEALERFASSSRAARIAALDESVWRRLCERAFVAPQPIPSARIMQDPRRCFIESPRLRTDGAYIAVVTYMRRGDSSQAWYSPTHMVTFYRYLRFYPSGLVLSLLTTEAPGETVRALNPALRKKGLVRGRWRLAANGTVDLWQLEDPAVRDAERKYAFRMRCGLKSTARGRMNKLEMLSLATERKDTRELEDVPIKPTKPFFFSKVAAYAGPDE